MRNASKNTIKRVMRNAKFNQKKGYYFSFKNPYSDYFLFNNVGAQIYRMSKGNIFNRSLKGINKYLKPTFPRLGAVFLMLNL